MLTVIPYLNWSCPNQSPLNCLSVITRVHGNYTKSGANLVTCVFPGIRCMQASSYILVFVSSVSQALVPIIPANLLQ